ncbi:MAG: tRNA 2-thiouridine(34) synthase MnmA [Planctomyces sp.]|nr:tRNA 2-thiouridine(34) synthase MnmA [Planctomyces sp.]
MSGGVDSSASAWLLRQQGHEVIGLFMRSGANEETQCRPGELPVLALKPHHQGCCSASDAADARRVADRLDIPFHALNFRDDFGRIKDYFADEYLAGRTPNPCVMCNIWLKFGRLWEFARQVDADFIATGHYARVAPGPDGGLALVRGRDAAKDQSYVLFGIRRDLLPNIQFPVGDRSKPEIRDLAREAGIQTADKPDSQEICFIPDNDYSGFLGRFRGPQETAGDIVDTAGRVLGQHQGYQSYTIGQRKGLGLAFGEPRYVVRIEPETRRVVIGTRDELGRRELTADRLNWLVDPPAAALRCTAQIRYQHTPAECTAEVIDKDRLQVTFDDPQFGIAPGQAVVLYDGDRVLGGGWIRSSGE